MCYSTRNTWNSRLDNIHIYIYKHSEKKENQSVNITETTQNLSKVLDTIGTDSNIEGYREGYRDDRYNLLLSEKFIRIG